MAASSQENWAIILVLLPPGSISLGTLTSLSQSELSVTSRTPPTAVICNFFAV